MTIGREILHSIWFVQIRRNKAICASPPPSSIPTENPSPKSQTNFGYSLLVHTQ